MDEYEYLNIFSLLVKEMVSLPESVKVGHRKDDRGLLVYIDVDPADRGKIIGKGGNIADAIRTIARVIGISHNAHISIQIVDDAA